MLQSPLFKKKRLGDSGGRGGGRRPATCAAGLLAIIAAICLGYFLFNTMPDGREAENVAASFRHRLSATACAHYGDVVQAASERGRQMSQAQLLWVAAFVREQSLARHHPARLLVFGFAELSDALAGVNCLGRTVFLESSQAQINALKGEQKLEIHLVSYRGKHDEADAFFAAPWLINTPAEVDSECFDVILIDGPPGTGKSGSEPARLESSHYALSKARRCIEEGKVEDVVLLLHDAQRPMEQRIAQQMLLPPDVGKGTAVQALGTVKDGNMGDLAAFRVASTRPVDAKKARKGLSGLLRIQKHQRA